MCMSTCINVHESCVLMHCIFVLQRDFHSIIAIHNYYYQIKTQVTSLKGTNLVHSSRHNTTNSKHNAVKYHMMQYSTVMHMHSTIHRQVHAAWRDKMHVTTCHQVKLCTQTNCPLKTKFLFFTINHLTLSRIHLLFYLKSFHINNIRLILRLLK